MFNIIIYIVRLKASFYSSNGNSLVRFQNQKNSASLFNVHHSQHR